MQRFAFKRMYSWNMKSQNGQSFNTKKKKVVRITAVYKRQTYRRNNLTVPLFTGENPKYVLYLIILRNSDIS